MMLTRLLKSPFWLSFSTEKVTDKNDAMVKSIANQNQKVEEETNKLVKAIEENSKKVESKEEEEKFQKASNKVDQLMKDGDDAVELKGDQILLSYFSTKVYCFFKKCP